MTDPVAAAMDWLTAPGPPNWLFLLALLTAPAYWSDKVRSRVTPLLDTYLPGRE